MLWNVPDQNIQEKKKSCANLWFGHFITSSTNCKQLSNFRVTQKRPGLLESVCHAEKLELWALRWIRHLKQASSVPVLSSFLLDSSCALLLNMSNQLAQQLTIMTGKLYCATYGILLIWSRKVSCRIILVRFYCTLRSNHSIYNVCACCPVAIRARFIRSNYMYVSFLLVYHRQF